MLSPIVWALISSRNGGCSSVRVGDEARRTAGYGHSCRQCFLFLTFLEEESAAVPIADR